MKKINYEKLLQEVQAHALTMLRGLVRTIYGTLVAGLAWIAISGFVRVDCQSGYCAVLNFVGSCATLAVAMSNVYVIGRKRRGGRK
jgi:hypothetical protein